MNKTEPKKRISYSLFLIPDNNRGIKKAHITEKKLYWILGVGALSFLFSMFHVIGFWHYKTVCASFEKDRQEIEAFREQKSELAGKVAMLEQTMGDTERLAGKLASLVGTERIQMQKGIGPIPNLPFDIKGKTEGLEPSALSPKVDRMQDTISNLQERIKELNQIQQDKLTYISSTPSIWPVKGWVTSEFGRRRSPFTLAADFHEGIDIAAQWGTPVIAAADGVVTFAGFRGGLGKAVIIDHGFGVVSYYGHTSQILVREGEHVSRGSKVALVGSTGHSTGPHLHYEIHVDGVPVDPMKYILQ
jgi:murein DD-endopeptidase MepM/ murein hydrolase activator NlpD